MVQILTDEETSRWLAERGIQRDPYRSEVSEELVAYQQFKVPRESGRCWAMAYSVAEVAVPFERALLDFTDWSHYSPDQMAIVSAVRASHGESRWLTDAPGHAFEAGEKDLLTGMLALTMTFGWEAYLYFEGGPTFLNWDGELLDVWVYREDQKEALETMAKFFDH